MKAPLSTIPRAWLEKGGIGLEACGRSWRLCRHDNLEDLWNAMSDADFDEDKIPYWTELWPASLALAEWLRRRAAEIGGRRCLDLGCGLGLTALVGQWLGARMAAVDLARDALAFCRLNAAENSLSQAAWIAMDWRAPAFRKGVFWRIWAGDILYERRFMAPVADFLGHALAPGGVAWLAEPGRLIFGEFLEEMGRRGWSMREVFALSPRPAHPQKAEIRARVWEARKGEGAA